MTRVTRLCYSRVVKLDRYKVTSTLLKSAKWTVVFWNVEVMVYLGMSCQLETILKAGLTIISLILMRCERTSKL